MIVYLDSVIVIYLIEGPDPFRVRARARLAQIVAAGGETAISHLIRLECRVKPIRLSDAARRFWPIPRPFSTARVC